MSAETKRSPIVANLARRIYRHVAAMLAAIGLAAALKDALGLDWRGWLRPIVGLWDTAIRPVTEWLCTVVVTIPLDWLFGWHVQVPTVLRDYLAVGLILTLSYVRAVDSPRGLSIRTLRMRWPLILFWPATLLLSIASVMIYVGSWLLREPGESYEWDDDFQEEILTIAPLIYLSALTVINYLVF